MVIVPDSPETDEVAVEMKATLKKGTMFIHTDFTSGGEVIYPEVFKFPHEKSPEFHESTLESRWNRLTEEIAVLQEVAAKYAAIKLRGKKSDGLARQCLAAAVPVFAHSFSEADDSAVPYLEGTNVDVHSVMKIGESLQAMRTPLDDNPANKESPHRPKLDPMEEALFDVETKLERAKYVFDNNVDFDDDDDDEHSGSIAVLDGEKRDPTEDPMAIAFEEFCFNLEAALEAANNVWWEAANALHEKKPIHTPGNPKELTRYYSDAVASFSEYFTKAKSAFERFESKVKENNLSFNLHEIHDLAYGGEGSKGIFPHMQKLEGIIHRPNLITTAIEQGLPQQSKKS